MSLPDPRRDDSLLRESIRAIAIFEALEPVEKARIEKLVNAKAEDAIGRLVKHLGESQEKQEASEILDGMFGPKHPESGARDPRTPRFKQTWANARRLAVLVILNDEGLLPSTPPPPRPHTSDPARSVVLLGRRPQGPRSEAERQRLLLDLVKRRGGYTAEEQAQVDRNLEKIGEELEAARKPVLPPSYQNHPAEGRRVRTKVDAEFNGHVVAKGSTGVVRWVQPAFENCYLVKIDGDDADTLYERGIRGFTKDQLEFVDRARESAP